jgi:hypothetical protein
MSTPDISAERGARAVGDSPTLFEGGMLMMERNRNRWAWAIALPMLCALLLTSGHCSGWQEEEEGANEPVVVKKFRGRLPAYFSGVVTSEQRQEIYELQKEYHEKLVALEEEMAKLKAARDEEIDGILTVEQLAEVKKKRAAAAAKRKSRQAAQEDSADQADAAESSG